MAIMGSVDIPFTNSTQVASNAQIVAIDREKDTVSQQYNLIYNNEKLIDEVIKTELKDAYDDYLVKYSDLKTAISSVTVDGALTAAYKDAYVRFQASLTKATNDIAARAEIGPINDGDIEDIPPPTVANITATGLFKYVLVEWDFVNTIAIAGYEVYASQSAGFTPSSSNLVFLGKTNMYPHVADTNQTWYFKVRAVNTHGTYGAFSDQATGSTTQVATFDMMVGSVNSQILADLGVQAKNMAGQSVTANAMANLAVGNLAVQNLAIGNSKMDYLSVGTSQMQDLSVVNSKIGFLAVDDAKIKDVSIGKLKAGTIDTSILNIFGGSTAEYTKIIGSYLESFGRYSRTWRGTTTVSDVALMFEHGYMRARNSSLNRSLYISDYGISTQIDGSNASGVIEFFSDLYGFGAGVTVSSEAGAVALKTWNANPIILDPNTYAEVRGELRAQYFRTNTTNAYMGVDPGGELRVTNQNFYNGGSPVYQNVHANGYIGNFLNTESGQNAYIGTDLELRVTSRSLGSGSIVYRPIRVQGAVTGYTNFYVSASGETRIVNSGIDTWGSNHTYGDLRVSGLYANSLNVNDGDNLYLRIRNVSGVTNAAKVTYLGTTESYAPIWADTFTVKSNESVKTDINPFECDEINILKSVGIYEYFYKWDEEKKSPKIGPVIERSPALLSHDGEGVESHRFTSILWKITQKQQEIIEQLEQRVQVLESA